MYLYAIGTTGSRQKIGFSADPQQRLKTLQTANSEVLFLHYSFPIDPTVASRFERHVHVQHGHRRIKGEWFDMSPEEIVAMMQYHEIMAETITASL